MGKTVELVLKSEHCEETLELPAELWKRFEQRAQELEITVEELLPMLLDSFIKDPDVAEKIRDYIEKEEGSV